MPLITARHPRESGRAPPAGGPSCCAINAHQPRGKRVINGAGRPPSASVISNGGPPPSRPPRRSSRRHAKARTDLDANRRRTKATRLLEPRCRDWPLSPSPSTRSTRVTAVDGAPPITRPRQKKRIAGLALGSSAADGPPRHCLLRASAAAGQGAGPAEGLPVRSRGPPAPSRPHWSARVARRHPPTSRRGRRRRAARRPTRRCPARASRSHLPRPAAPAWHRRTRSPPPDIRPAPSPHGHNVKLCARRTDVGGLDGRRSSERSCRHSPLTTSRTTL